MSDDEHLEVTPDPVHIPVGSVPSCSLFILGFIAPDGSYGYAIKQGGSGYVTEYLGLMRLAEHELLKTD